MKDQRTDNEREIGNAMLRFSHVALDRWNRERCMASLMASLSAVGTCVWDVTFDGTPNVHVRFTPQFNDAFDAYGSDTTVEGAFSVAADRLLSKIKSNRHPT